MRTSQDKDVHMPLEQSERIKQDAARLIFQLPLAALAMGAVGRSAFGLRDLLGPPSLQPPGLTPGTQFIPMPQIGKEEEEKKRQPKLAVDDPTKYKDSTHLLGRLADPASRWFYERFLAGPGHMISDAARNVSGVPYTYSLGLPLAALGFGAGYKGMDAALDSRRHAERQRELEKTKAQYYSLLQGKTAAWPAMPETHQTSNLNPITSHIYNKITQPGSTYGPAAGPQAGPATHTALVKGSPAAQFASGHSLNQAKNNSLYGKPNSPGFADAQLTGRATTLGGGPSLDFHRGAPDPTATGSVPVAPLQKGGEAELFDKLAEAVAGELEKTADPAGQASILDSVPFGEQIKAWGPQLAGMGINATLATALLSALGAGTLSYSHFRGNSQRKTIEEALRRRASAEQPGPAMVYTSPTAA
jgi:hypothetical protein